MLYPQKMNSNKTNFIVKMLGIISIVIGLLLILINKIVSPNIHWAALCNAGIIYIWITTMYSLNKNVNIAGHVLLQTIAISIFILYIDYKLGFRAWSIDIAIPIVIIISNISMLILTIISHKKYFKYALNQLGIVLFSMLPLYGMIENVVQNKILSIIAIGVSVINLIVCFILCSKELKEAIIRNFHM